MHSTLFSGLSTSILIIELRSFFFDSLHVVSLPHWAGFVREGRTCEERGNSSLLYQV